FDGSFEYSNIVEVEIVNPSEFILEQNYPNPFNPSTTIKYSIQVVDANFASTTLVHLRIYDVLGNEVAALVNENKSAGNYVVEFNANDLSSGVYFYKLNVGNKGSTKKMILLR
ncbi:MAG TPA: T9SS type A sorting domain-containing protein, partial [Ignavibacteriaceae bacterium]|nr:T9SS type A sorting domain-containing protein [Ignavibacteriaceae bacterium]